jgi:Predicted RNA-binding protein containing a PIN domain
MSLHYLLDGYNLVKQIPALADKGLADGRDGLIRWITVHRPQGSANNQVSVIFDGKPDVFGSNVDGVVKVIFTRYDSADVLLKQMVEESSARANLVVVSDDKGIILYVRALGAKVLSVREFARGLFFEKSALRASREKGKSRGTNSKAYLSLVKQDKINKELSHLWLKEK